MSKQMELEGISSTESFSIRSPRVLAKDGSIPDGWSFKSASELSNIKTGHTPSRDNPEYWKGNIPWIAIHDLTENNTIEIQETSESITQDGLENSGAKLLPRGTFVLCRTGSIGASAILGKEMATDQSTVSFECINEVSNPYYLKYVFSNSQSELDRLGIGSTHPSIQLDFFPDLQIPTPPIEEQHKIATVLQTVDKAIGETEKILTQLSRVKKGLYQSLFSEGYQHHNQYKSTKYGEIPVSWDISKLSEVTSRIQAGGTPDTSVSEYYGGDIPWVKTGELSQNRVTQTEQTITERGLEESTARMFSPGTVLIAMYGATTGEVSLLDTEATTNQACCGVVTTDEMRPEFLFHQLTHLSNHLKSLSAGSGQQNISKGIIEKFGVLVPSVKEQDSIIGVLNSVGESIEANKAAKNQYQQLKRGLMQDLLSGKVRTTDTNIEVPEEIKQHG